MVRAQLRQPAKSGRPVPGRSAPPASVATSAEFSHRTPVYELTDIVPTRSRLQASAARGLTRFVGRDSELLKTRLAVPYAGGLRGP